MSSPNPVLAEPIRVFVYGTLRRGYPHRMATYLESRAEWLGEVVVLGELYSLGSYPGLVSPGETRVLGDLYALPAASSAETLRALDAYEGCSDADPRPHQYRKEEVVVLMSGGESLTAWTYLLNRPEDAIERIASGDFVTWQRNV
jgi:gamma-glutamylcyclotransferase (GGCT)/AIG2-like uncharacterized protein YtfP